VNVHVARRVVLVCVMTFATADALAAIPICVDVRARGISSADTEGMTALVENEVRRQPSHTLATGDDCEATLVVELVEVALDGGKKRVATAYLDGQTPHRRELGTAETFSEHLEYLVSAALGTDPRRLMADDAALEDTIDLAENRPMVGEMLYGVEVGQATAFLTSGASFSPSLAVRIRRGLGPFHIGARLRAAFLPVEPVRDGDPVPTVNVALEPEFAWFVSPDAAISFYLAAAIGISVIRFDGWVGDEEQRLVDFGVHSTVRIGTEFLRTADFRVDAFASVSLPWSTTDSENSPLVDEWTPTVEVGFGVAF
jgi:hypothetical protein